MPPIIAGIQILNGLLQLLPVGAQTIVDIKKIFTSDPAVQEALNQVIADTISTSEKARQEAEAWLQAHGG